MKDQVTALRARGLGVVVGVMGLVGCDHATKYVAKAELQEQPAQALIEPVLSLRYVENTDIAFNLLSIRRWRASGHAWRVPLMTLNSVVIVFLLVLVALDVSELVS